MLLSLVLILSLIYYVSSTHKFMTIGDWGASSTEDNSYPANAAEVASSMGNYAKNNQVSFVINTGDNFYWCGITNTSDFQVSADYIDVYLNPPIRYLIYISIAFIILLASGGKEQEFIYFQF